MTVECHQFTPPEQLAPECSSFLALGDSCPQKEVVSAHVNVCWGVKGVMPVKDPLSYISPPPPPYSLERPEDRRSCCPKAAATGRAAELLPNCLARDTDCRPILNAAPSTCLESWGPEPALPITHTLQPPTICKIAYS
ncbi:unnamed protein product [Natator depressus]